jgi:hypothetical protein
MNAARSHATHSLGVKGTSLVLAVALAAVALAAVPVFGQSGPYTFEPPDYAQNPGPYPVPGYIPNDQPQQQPQQPKHDFNPVLEGVLNNFLLMQQRKMQQDQLASQERMQQLQLQGQREQLSAQERMYRQQLEAARRQQELQAKILRQQQLDQMRNAKTQKQRGSGGSGSIGDLLPPGIGPIVNKKVPKVFGF